MDESKLIEKQYTSELIFDGKVVHLYKDQVILPDGSIGLREYVKHIGAVSVLPLTDNEEVLLVEQYRYPHHVVMIETPAGKLDSKDEDHRLAALRELREETGATCQTLTYIGPFYSTPAICDEHIDLYLAEGLSFGEQDLDEDEFLQVKRMPLTTLVDMVMNGEIPDGKTQVMALKVKELLERRKKGNNV